MGEPLGGFLGHYNPNNIYFISSKPAAPTTLTEKEQGYVKRLADLDLNSILDMGAGEKKCKDIGQEIFNAYKTSANGDSKVGEVEVKKICEATKSCQDGRLRKQYIERAWAGIGDDKWSWRS